MIIATAGHVDHGKSSLVQALTGVDPDRLPEEKRRGMTIDLGFAYAGPLGFVDVPGHERFVHNMLAGVAGIDHALLVVAADDGPMPQTVEHLAILDLLGVRTGTVALSKVDRVDEARLRAVALEIDSLLASTGLAGAPLVRVSSRTGEGIEALRNALLEEASRRAPRKAQGHFRLAIDRAFTLPGAGLVVTGTVLSGRVGAGDPVRLLGSGLEARVRALHSHHQPVGEAAAGQRCAVNLAGDISKEHALRGEWLVAGPVPAPVRRMDVRLRVLAGEHPLRHWTAVHVHLGTAQAMGRVAVLEGGAIAPGTEALAQLVLESPLGAVHADRFIVRDASARRTLGGGSVVDVFPPARGRARPERLAQLRALAIEEHAAAFAALLEVSPAGVLVRQFTEGRNLPGAHFDGAGHREAGGLAWSSQCWATLKARVLDRMAGWHRAHPDSPAMPDNLVLDGLGLKLPREVHSAVAMALVEEKALVRAPAGGVCLPGHGAKLAPEDEALWARARPALDSVRPPTTHELAKSLLLEPARLEAALARLARHGILTRVTKTRFFVPARLAKLAAVTEAAAGGPGGRLTAAMLRDASSTGRNVAIELLEYFDRVKFTRRVGDEHLVLRPAAQAFGPPEGRE